LAQAILAQRQVFLYLNEALMKYRAMRSRGAPCRAPFLSLLWLCSSCVQVCAWRFRGQNCIKNSVVVGTIVKNMEGSVSRGVQEMVKIATLFCNHHIIIFENDSEDHTADAVRQSFEQVKGITQNLSFYSEHLEDLGTRTSNIAQARNKLLNHITEQFKSFDFMIMMDLDMGSDHAERIQQLYHMRPFPQCSINTTVIRQAMQLSVHWDALSFRVDPYWDIWALRADFAPDNVWGESGGGANQVVEYEHKVELQLNKLKEDELLPVDSAFMLLEIIKIPMALGVTYRGELNDEMDCEHVAFNKQMQSAHGARVRISPMELCLNHTTNS